MVMSSILPVNIENLIDNRGVENARVEYKASWDAATTGFQILKTICAFANDLQNLNGGYIVIGIAEQNGRALLPPRGLDPDELDEIQKWIRGNCNRIDPEYQPVISPELFDGKYLLALWVPGSETRPHKAPDGKSGDRKYWVRLGSESVDAEKNGVLQSLLQLTARVPFDDRRAFQAEIEDLREMKVREFLHDVRSGLLDETNTKDLYRKMRIAAPVNSHDTPLNIGLLLFTDNPEQWFPGARIEVVQFAADASGNVLEEKIFKGGLHEQIRDCLAYLENIATQHIEKQEAAFRVRGWVSYPLPALREALVNAIYHRGYEGIREPVKVYLYSDRIEIISYPGPVPGIREEHLKPGGSLPPVPARNRRIGEFLKELRLAEGRGTGLPKVFAAMKQNGSPEPRFDFDEERTYFRVTLSAHPEYLAISALRDAAHLRALGDFNGAVRRLEDAWRANSISPTLTAELIRVYGSADSLTKAELIYSEYKKNAPLAFIPHVTNVLINVFFEVGREAEAQKYLEELPAVLSAEDSFDAAILARRLGRHELAHRYFDKAGDGILNNARALHEFAQTKMELAQKLWRNRQKQYSMDSNIRLLKEARELLERVIQLEADDVRHAWAWRDLGRVLRWLKSPRSEIKAAYERAIRLLPLESKFREELVRWEKSLR
jgi:ATP-dependent DNA helicase RecG